MTPSDAAAISMPPMSGVQAVELVIGSLAVAAVAAGAANLDHRTLCRKARALWPPCARRPTNCHRRCALLARNCRRSGRCNRGGNPDGRSRHRRSRSRPAGRGSRRRTDRGCGRRCSPRPAGPALRYRFGNIVGARWAERSSAGHRIPMRACRSTARHDWSAGRAPPPRATRLRGGDVDVHPSDWEIVLGWLSRKAAKALRPIPRLMLLS